MSKPKVYLAGPIAGLTYDEAEEWRRTVKYALEPLVDCFCPLRSHDFLRQGGVINSGKNYDHNALTSDRGIMTRDHNDCKNSDLVFVNLIGSTKASVGTAMEVAWCYAYRKPVVVVMEDHGNPHDHPMMREAFGYRVSNIADAINITLSVLFP
jgi:nucleoside 2-deoxyribosyltransferase